MNGRSYANVNSEILLRGPAQFDMCGQFLGYPLQSPGLVKRLVKYAVNQMVDHGFPCFGKVRVYTMDGDERPADRDYCVEFINSKGNGLGVQRILMKNGHPFLDHGFYVIN